MTYNNGDKYDGYWSNNLREGKGIMTYKNGDKYDGNWKNDIREGEGKIYFFEGYYQGIWKNNEFNGNVEIFYYNKKRFKGILKNGKREGEAIIINENMEKIELNFNNDVIVGKGKLTFNNGNILIGNFNNKDYNPIDGIINFPNGDIYEGEFKENFKLKGKMKYNTGEIYDGELENFIKNGKGLFCLNENDYKIVKTHENNLKEIFNLNLNDFFYIGNFKDNNKEGEGILYIKDEKEFSNVIYKGNFINNMRNGFGKIYFKTGSILESNWKNNEIDEKKDCIFYLNKDIKYKRNNYNINGWTKFIKLKILKYFGAVKKIKLPKILEDKDYNLPTI